MDYLLAEIKGRTGGLSMVLSDKTVFDVIPSFVNTRTYDDDYKLQNGEWCVVDEFSSKSYWLDILKNNFDATAYSNLSKKLYRKIAYVISVQEDEEGNEVQTHLYVKTLFIGSFDNIENYIEVEEVK